MNNTTTVNEVNLMFSLEVTITIGILSTLLAVLTTGGNLLVLLAFATDSTIRKFGDYFILNLAVADFIIGCLCIPPYIPYLLTGEWSIGRFFCKFWLVLDYVAPATSTLAVCVISIDRYLSVAYAISYKGRQSNRLRNMMLVTPWVITFCVFCPAIVFWEMVSGVDDLPESVCVIPYHKNLGYLLFGGFVEFILPLTIIITLNFLLFLNVRKRSRIGITGQSRPSVFTVSDARSGTESTQVGDTPNPGRQIHLPVPIGTSLGKPNKGNDKFSRDRRVAKSLFTLVFIFVICWMPFEIMSMVLSVSPDAIHPTVFEVAFWILWINSTVNPILYPFLHTRIRKAFIKLI
ncbi:hypothetical protein LOTGIDRAFT_190505, partial [Lottia gigantea]